jgi:plastocyanin domain-containing protein
MMIRRLVLCLPLVLTACKKDTKPNAAPPAADGRPRIAIAVTEQGFEPANIQVPRQKPVTLVFDRQTDQTCAKQVVIDLGGGNKVERDLPLHEQVAVAVAFPKAGTLSYACGMDMIKGTITVQ